MKGKSIGWSIQLIAKFGESSVPKRKVDLHRRPKPIRNTIERELSLLSIHFGNCETSPTVVVPSLTPLSASCPLFSKGSCCFSGLKSREIKLFRWNIIDYFRYANKSFSRQIGIVLLWAKFYWRSLFSLMIT